MLVVVMFASNQQWLTWQGGQKVITPVKKDSKASTVIIIIIIIIIHGAFTHGLP